MPVQANTVGHGKRRLSMRGASGWVTADGRHLVMQVWRTTWALPGTDPMPAWAREDDRGRWVVLRRSPGAMTDLHPDAYWIAGAPWVRGPGSYRTLADANAYLLEWS